MRHLQPVLVLLLLIAACTQISALRDAARSNNTDDAGHGIRLADEEVARIASALGQRSSSKSTGKGFSYFDFILGALVACGGAAFLEYRYNFRLLNRKQKAEAIQAFKDMDVHQLREALGSANLPSWINFPDFERVNWLNLAYLTKQAHPQLDPLLTQSKPTWIKDVKLIKFDLGERGPHVSGVKVYQADKTPEEVIMECDFMWAGQQDVQILVEPVPRIVSKALVGIGTIISKLIRLKVSMMRLIINGRMRITLKPLLDDMPIVGAIQVSLVEMPDFSFDLEVLGGDITLLPGLEAWLNSLIRTSVLRPYVLPDKYVVQLTDTGLGIETPKGILFVKLLEAEHVPKMDVLSKSDPYVKLGVRASRMANSQVINNDLNPKWNEDFKLLVHEPEHQDLTLELYDFDSMDNDDLIGGAKIHIKDLENRQEKDLWLEIEPVKAEKSSHKGVRGKMRAVKEKGSEAVDKTRRKLGRGQHDKSCRLHIKVTYYEFKSEEMDAAMQSQQEPGGLGHIPSQVENKEAFNILMGGVLYVRGRKAHHLVHKPWYKGGILKSTATLKVSVVGHTKKTVRVEGSEPLFDDTLEFILGADEIQEADSKNIEVEVWDYKLVNHFRGVAQISLKDVLDNKRVKDTYRLKGVDHGELELELRWMRALDTQPRN